MYDECMHEDDRLTPGDLKLALEVFRRGDNVTEFFLSRFGFAKTQQVAIEVAYELQAGSCIAFAERNSAAINEYATEIAALISRYASRSVTMLDAGTGELTTLSTAPDRTSGGTDFGFPGWPVQGPRLSLDASRLVPQAFRKY